MLELSAQVLGQARVFLIVQLLIASGPEYVVKGILTYLVLVGVPLGELGRVG